MKYKTRFAPSPTGMLHIGGVRTALFDYLAAKSTGGEFNLRIEDTDRERFVEGALEAVHEGLSWLGIKYDGEVISQSDRVPLYNEFAQKLLENGSAYRCFCTSERLASLKEQQISAKKAPVYDRCCLKLTDTEIKKNIDAKKPSVIRFKIPNTSVIPANAGIHVDPRDKHEDDKLVSWADKVRGEISIPINTLEDFIIIKSDGWPTYNFANVIDDHDMAINLVIRGDEFVPSTPKHILLYQALGWEHPNFAHVPVIVGSDMKKLSKRNGDTALSEYIAKGYLPEAMINFLVFLGWNPGSTKEIFTLAELEKAFSIDRVGKSPAIFDIERLNYINGIYIRKLSVKELTNKLLEFDNNSISSRHSRAGGNLDFLEKVVTVEQSRLHTLGEFGELAGFYWNLPKYSPDTLVFKKSSPEATKKGLAAILAVISEIDEPTWSKMCVDDWNALLTKVVADNSLTNADVFWPARVALSGLDKSPSPAELLWVLGKIESVKRIKGTR